MRKMGKDALHSGRRSSARRIASFAAFVYRAAIAASAVIVGVQVYAWLNRPFVPAVAFIEANQRLDKQLADALRDEMSSPELLTAAWQKLGVAASERPSAMVTARLLNAPEGKTRWAVAAAARRPADAAALASSLARSFVESRQAAASGGSQMAEQWRAASQSIGASLARLSSELSRAQQRFGDLRPAADELREQTAALDAASPSPSLEPEQPIREDEPSPAARELAKLQAERADLAVSLTPRHPDVGALDRRIALLRSRVAAEEPKTPPSSVASAPSAERFERGESLLAESLQLATSAVDWIEQTDLARISDALSRAAERLSVASAEATGEAPLEFRELIVPAAAHQAGPVFEAPTIAAALLLGLIAAALAAGRAAGRLATLAEEAGAPLLGVAAARSCGWTRRRRLHLPNLRAAGALMVAASHVVVIGGSLMLAALATGS